MNESIVAVVRHGNKVKDSSGVEILDNLGVIQIIKTVLKLSTMMSFQKILYSGEERTLQCANVAQNIPKHSSQLPPESFRAKSSLASSLRHFQRCELPSVRG